MEYFNLYIDEYLEKRGITKEKNKQIDLFTGIEEDENNYDAIKMTYIVTVLVKFMT